MSQAKWARVESSVNLDASGSPDPYFMSLDLATARHLQTLLATHFNGQPLTVDHGAPLRLLVPVKLGLKNVKAITKISYVAEEPRDYYPRPPSVLHTTVGMMHQTRRRLSLRNGLLQSRAGASESAKAKYYQVVSDNPNELVVAIDHRGLT